MVKECVEPVHVTHALPRPAPRRPAVRARVHACASACGRVRAARSYTTGRHKISCMYLDVLDSYIYIIICI